MIIAYRCQEHNGMLAQKDCACCGISVYIKRLEAVATVARKYNTQIQIMSGNQLGKRGFNAIVSELNVALAELDGETK
jgi:hypothetical protein